MEMFIARCIVVCRTPCVRYAVLNERIKNEVERVNVSEKAGYMYSMRASVC